MEFRNTGIRRLHSLCAFTGRRALSHPDIGRDVDVCPAMRAVLLAPPSAREAEDHAAELQAGDVRADAPFAIGLAHGERDLRPHENVVPDPVAERGPAPELAAPCRRPRSRPAACSRSDGPRLRLKREGRGGAATTGGSRRWW